MRAINLLGMAGLFTHQLESMLLHCHCTVLGTLLGHWTIATLQIRVCSANAARLRYRIELVWSVDPDHIQMQSINQSLAPLSFLGLSKHLFHASCVGCMFSHLLQEHIRTKKRGRAYMYNFSKLELGRIFEQYYK